MTEMEGSSAGGVIELASNTGSNGITELDDALTAAALELEVTRR